MAEGLRIGLDNAAFHGRLRQPVREPAQAVHINRSPQFRTSKRYFSDLLAVPPESLQQQKTVPGQPQPVIQEEIVTPPPESVISVLPPQPYAQPALPKQQPSRVLKRQALQLPTRLIATVRPRGLLQGRSKLQVALIGMAGFIFILGLAVSLQTIETNHRASTQVAALASSVRATSTSKPVTKSVPVPSITKPSATTTSNYTVAPDAPRYLSIPAIGVHDAIILNLGILSSGALATPPNVYETGWYNQSSLPGQPGAMLIDGHVSSWTAHGVFYGLVDLKPGDQVQVQRGDGTVYTYQVVKSQTYPSTGVNMQAAVTPITTGVPGLNLITCTGQVEPGTSEFNQRIIVFTQLVSS